MPHLIGGEPVNSAAEAVFENHTPLDNTFITNVALGDNEDINRAVMAAKAAFPAWRDIPAAERKTRLHAVADLIEANSEEIALLEVLDTGQTIKFMSKAAERAADNFRFFADRAESAQDGLALPTDGHLNYTMRQPIGPVGIITPWNTPFMLSTWKIAPALAAGCTVVHKPAEWSPITAIRLAELIHEAGIPPGVVNVVNGMGEVAGKALTEHPDIKAIGFVGDSETGKAIMRQGSDTLKRVHFELGGKNPVVVFADSDLERALDAVLFMIYSLNGERCTSSSRLLVERGIYDDFIARLVERVRNLKVGDPFDKLTDIGPLIHPTHLEKVMRYVTVGCEEGATLAAGGNRPEGLGDGNYFEPTLFAAATGDMRIAQEEVFGPFLTALPFDSEDEALALANNTKYGLAAYLWTGDVRRAHTFSQRLDAGMIWVNSQNVRYLPTPFGGMKSSGIGRDGGDYSFDFYMETKNIDVALGDHRIPKLG
ncbi:MAG: 5-carboxymethyl-2-hydroxymuconate semialdehyde dehydrogenase [Candidatus Latescibacteria bacterium]|nr:5-carboxymethyl-2-hydroxymuconate semialdehyde dehydrogenase [Candidatus Latescibacterota bacterium]